MTRSFSGVIEGFYGAPWSNNSRKQLFQWMEELEMNTYMYAPKDDEKHRNEWRKSYNKTECGILQDLITSCHNHKISFVYAISPGLDIVFSSEKDVEELKKKLQQVYALGCRCFAILFDDIDPELCLADKREYSSSAHAQVALTNKLYDWFDGDLDTVFFCPTEYCETRAKPDIETSDYLRTIGSELKNEIQIFWTGPKVVPAEISCDSLENLTKILQRKPVIWDNIHANDYDDRRVYLGPYKGRPLGLYVKTNGILTNPNCQFHSNFIAFESLGKWYKIAMDHSKNPAMSSLVYDAEEVLTEICKKWMKKLFEKQKRNKTIQLNGINSLNEDELDMVGKDLSDDGDDDDKEKEENEVLEKSIKKEPSKDLDHRDLEIICHFFFLPYENGEIANDFKNKFQWLKKNSLDLSKKQPEDKEKRWHLRAQEFIKTCSDLCLIFAKFCLLPNKQIISELQVYMKEAQDTINLLKKYVEFLGSKEREREGGMVPRDPEAWFYRGGLIGELERLVPTSEEDIFPINHTHLIRPCLPSDKEEIYKFCNDINYIPSAFEHDDLAFDSTAGPWLEFDASYSFVLQVDGDVCGFVFGHKNAKEFYEFYQNSWIQKMRMKYKIPSVTSTEQKCGEEQIRYFHQSPFVPDDKCLSQYPCVVAIYVLPKFKDSEITFKAIQCLSELLENKFHLVERKVKRKEKELLKELGFNVHNSRNDDFTLFLYDN